MRRNRATHLLLSICRRTALKTADQSIVPLPVRYGEAANSGPQNYLSVVEEECAVVTIEYGDCMHEMYGIGCKPRVGKLKYGAGCAPPGDALQP